MEYWNEFRLFLQGTHRRRAAGSGVAVGITFYVEYLATPWIMPGHSELAVPAAIAGALLVFSLCLGLENRTQTRQFSF